MDPEEFEMGVTENYLGTGGALASVTASASANANAGAKAGTGGAAGASQKAYRKLRSEN
ncbi:hypothetical protein DVH05_021637 [Phytophthora capsici]|nr:hypothetical protein DVH05_021637 [Phytophthora capsici]